MSTEDSVLWEDKEAWCAAVHGVTELDMTQQLNNNNMIYLLPGVHIMI